MDFNTKALSGECLCPVRYNPLMHCRLCCRDWRPK